MISIDEQIKKANEYDLDVIICGRGGGSIEDLWAFNEESVAICALFHDICKTRYYKQSTRNVKENGVWVEKPFYTVEDALPYGHGEKSVYIINGYMRLTREEAMAINWHMGGFDPRAQASESTLWQPTLTKMTKRTKKNEQRTCRTIISKQQI